ncbi:MAG: hypothetical protein ACRDSF_00075 [Pseudonocardiaceae bacterium]
MATTWETLADELDKLQGVPNRVVRAARRGHFSEFRSGSPTPKQDLILILQDIGGFDAFIARIVAGEFDDTDQEAKEWMTSRDGMEVLRQMFPGITQERWKRILGLSEPVATPIPGGVPHAPASSG